MITDFDFTGDALRDQLHISTSTGLNSFAEVAAAGAAVDGNFVITFASGGTLTLQGITSISNTAVFVVDENTGNIEQNYFEPFYLDW